MDAERKNTNLSLGLSWALCGKQLRIITWSGCVDQSGYFKSGLISGYCGTTPQTEGKVWMSTSTFYMA